MEFKYTHYDALNEMNLYELNTLNYLLSKKKISI